MRRNFFICGLTGWCLEILFTSIGNCSRCGIDKAPEESRDFFKVSVQRFDDT